MSKAIRAALLGCAFKVRVLSVVGVLLVWWLAPVVLGAAPVDLRTVDLNAARGAAAPAVVGTVTDSSGAPLANATVLVAEVGRATTTNAQGVFVFRGLPMGEYHLSVTLIGFRPGHAVVRVPESGDDVRVAIALRFTPLRLSAVVVSASPTGTESEHLTQTALELSGRALNRSLGSTVASTLAAEPGVNQRFHGPASSMPVIRGLTGDRILMLQDGERAGDLAASSTDHAVSVDPLAAQRIEVVRGPASLLYGNNALGGVVNVISNDIPTSVPTHLEGTISVQSESATPGGAVNAGLTTDLGARSAINMRAGFRDIGSLRTGGSTVLEGTDSRTYNGTVGYGFIGEKANFGVAVRAYDFTYGLPAPAGDPEAGVRIDGNRYALSGRGAMQLRSPSLPYVRLEGTAQDYTHDEIEPSGEIGTTFKLRTQTFNVQATTAFSRSKGALGLQGLFKQYAATGEEALTPAANSSSLGVFLYQEVPIGSSAEEIGHGPRVQIGGRFDTYLVDSKVGDAKFGPAMDVDFTSGSGSVGLSVPLGEVFTMSGSLARAFRAPTVEELFSNGFHHAAGTYDIGNTSLRAEISTGAEVILRAQSERVSAQLSAYANRVDDFIAPFVIGDTLSDTGEEFTMIRFDRTDAELVGAEGSVEMQLLPHLVGSVMADYVRGSFRTGGALPFMPPARIGGGMRYETGRYSLGADVRHGFAQDRVSGGDVDIATDAYTLVNLNAGIQWLVGNALQEVLLRVDNAGDARYFDATSRIKSFAANSGRNVSLVYRLTF